MYETQREIAMKLSAKADPSLTQPLKEMAKSTKDAAKEEADYQKLLSGRIEGYKIAQRLKADLAKVGIGVEMTEEQKYQQMLRERIKSYETALRLKKDLARAGVGAGEKGLFDKGIGFLASPGFGHAATGAAIGGAIAKELSSRVAGQRIAEYGYDSSGRFGIDPHAREGRNLKANADTMKMLLGWIPGLGGAVESHNYAKMVSSNYYRVEQNLRESREAVERNQALGERRLGLTLGQRGYEREAAHYHAMAGYSPEQQASASASATQARKEVKDRQARLREAERAVEANRIVRQQAMVTWDPVTNSTNRWTDNITASGERHRPEQEAAAKRERDRHKIALEEAQAKVREQEDILSFKAFGVNSASQQARLFLQGQQSIDRFQGTLGQNPNAAGYNRQAALADYQGTVHYQTAKQQAEIESRRQLGILGHQQTMAARQEGQARRRQQSAQAAVDMAGLSLAAPGLTSTQQDERRNALLQTRNELDLANKEIKDAIGHSTELQVRQSEILNEQSQKRLALLEGESTRLHSIIREENERETGRREHFGLAHPRKQRTAFGIAHKLSQGKQLTQKEIEFAGGMPELFDHRLKQIGIQRTGQGSVYQQIRGLLPELGQRQQQAEKALTNVNLQFHNQIQLNEVSLADQLQKKLLPDIYRAIQQAINSVRDENLRFAHQQQAQQRAQMRQE